MDLSLLYFFHYSCVVDAQVVPSVATICFCCGGFFFLTVKTFGLITHVYIYIYIYI